MNCPFCTHAGILSRIDVNGRYFKECNRCGARSGERDTAKEAEQAWALRMGSSPTHERAAPAPEPVEVPGAVPVPQNEDQAALMVLLGERWLRERAPHRLRKASQPVAAEGAPRSCRMEDGRCGICGGDWSVCGCEGMLRKGAGGADQG